MKFKLLCVSMAILMLSGCGKAANANSQIDSSALDDNSFSDESSITTTSPDSSSNEPTVTQSPEEKKLYDSMANDFLTALKNCDTKKLMQDTAAFSEENFDFLKDIKIDSFKYESIKNDEGKGVFSVKLTVSKSQNEKFPVGESEWLLEVSPGAVSNVELFVPADSKIKSMNNWRKIEIKNISDMCYQFSNWFDYFSSCSDFNTIVPAVDNTNYNHFVYTSCVLYNIFNGEFSENITVPALTEFLNQRFGINNVDFTKSIDNKKTNSIYVPSKGGFWRYPALVSEQYNESTNQSTIIIDYYADSAYLVKAKTIKYVVQGKTVDDFKLLSTELIYDSGFKLAGGSV